MWTMGRAPGAAVALACALLTAGSAVAADSPPAATFAIAHARLFDGERVIEDATVVVRDGRIASAGRAPVPSGLPVVDATGKTLIPGLIDAHTHVLRGRADALRFGVTTELDMFAAATMLPSLRREREAMGPTRLADVFSAGTLATAPGGHGTEYGIPIPTLTAPDQADKWVADRVAEGSDWIKIVYQPPVAGSSPSIDRATLAALIRAAHARQKLAVVHIWGREAAAEAIAAGADGLVHTFSDAAADDAFYKVAKAKGVFIIPTLAVIGGVAGQTRSVGIADDPRLAPYLTAEQAQALRRTLPSSGRAARSLAIAMESAGRFDAAGTDVMAGTDTGNPTITHGASLHLELALMVEAGLTPIEALKAATSTPSRRFKLEERGRIAPGYRADLVLIDGDPTRRIEDTRAIAAIWKNGHPVQREPAPAVAAGGVRPLTGLLGGFETDLSGPDGLMWAPSADAIAGGKSEARIARTSPGAAGGQGALRMEGEVRTGGMAVWAGTQMPFSPTFSTPRDLSGAKALVFSVRGNVPQGMVMMTSNLAAGWPPQAFPITPTWTEVRLPLSGFAGVDPRHVLAFVISAAPTPGPYQIDVDQVRLE